VAIWRPPAKEAAQEELRRRRKLMLELLNLPTEGLFIGALRLQGIEENSPAWQAALAAWREHQKLRG
jgi:hypothetical protein